MEEICEFKLLLLYCFVLTCTFIRQVFKYYQPESKQVKRIILLMYKVMYCKKNRKDVFFAFGLILLAY